MKACGWYVLVKIMPVVMKSKGGIILGTANEEMREETGRDVGKVVHIGNCAYKDVVKDCNSANDWGVKVGDYVEFNRYDGKITRMTEYLDKYKGVRLILDKHIIANITDDLADLADIFDLEEMSKNVRSKELVDDLIAAKAGNV